MKNTLSIKSMMASTFYQIGGWEWRLKQLSGSDLFIVMYHRLLLGKEVQGYVQAGMYVTPDTFEHHLLFFKKHFSIVPIYELPSIPKRGFHTVNEKPCDVKPRLVITFDDGWGDFYTHAFPILKAHQVPATVFLPTDFIGTKKWFWTDRLAFLFCQKEKLRQGDLIESESWQDQREQDQKVRSPLISELLNLKGPLERRFEAAIGTLKIYALETIEETIMGISSLWGIEADPHGRAFLTWQEIRETSQSRIITFGSHTASHRILTTLKREEVEVELERSKERLMAEGVVDPSFIPFSYPNGNYNDSLVAMVKDKNYALSVTTEGGINRIDHKGPDPFKLRRISLHQDMTATEAMLSCRMAGIF